MREADNLTTFMCRMSWKSGNLNLLKHSGTHRACYETPLPFLYTYIAIDVSEKLTFPTFTTPEIQEDLSVFLKPED